MEYSVETVSYADGTFSVSGRVVGIVNSTPSQKRVSVLVESNEHVSVQCVTDDSKGMTLHEIADRERPEDAPLCTFVKDDGERCQRYVEDVGDRCWQHG